MDNYEGLLDGLLLYLQIRDWAFEKMKSHPVGAQVIDLEVHQYLYLSNALSATDLVGETLYGKDFRRPPYKTEFDRSLIAAFDMKVGTTSPIGGQEAYAFVRELRNSVVHRGLGSATSGHSNQDFVFALRPSVTTDSNGKNTYRSPWKYMVDLATVSNSAFNVVIYSELEKRKLFDLDQQKVAPLSDVMNAIDTSDVMPDWAKAMAHETFTKIDYSKIASEIMNTNLRDLQSHLEPR
jgi:L-rhamnose mutarotase